VQLDGDDLAQIIGTYEIRSVISLRGDNPNDAWYDEDLKVIKAQGAHHFDVGIGATTKPEPTVCTD
jgi:hypothetical protein